MIFQAVIPELIFGCSRGGYQNKYSFKGRSSPPLPPPDLGNPEFDILLPVMTLNWTKRGSA